MKALLSDKMTLIRQLSVKLADNRRMLQKHRSLGSKSFRKKVTDNIRQGNIKTAVSQIRQKIATQRKKGKAGRRIRAGSLNVLGNTQLATLDYKGAQKSFKKAVKLDPKNAQYWRNISQSSFKLKKYKSAVVALKKAIRLEPVPNYKDHKNMGMIMLLDDNPDQAADHFHKAISLYKKPGSQDSAILADLHRRLGESYKTNMHHYNKRSSSTYNALKHLNIALKYYRSSTNKDTRILASLYTSIGAAHLYRREYKPGLKAAKMALKLYGSKYKPDHIYMARASYLLGYAYYRTYGHGRIWKSRFSRNLGRQKLSVGIKHLHNALSVYVNYYGANHIKTANIYRHLARSYQFLRKYDVSIKYGFKYKNIVLKLYGATHAKVTDANYELHNYHLNPTLKKVPGYTYAKARHYEDINKKTTVMILYYLGRKAMKNKNYKKSLSYFKQGVRLVNKHIHHDSHLHRMFASNITDVRIKMKK